MLPRTPTPASKPRRFYTEHEQRAEAMLARDFWFKDNPFELTLYRLDRTNRVGGHRLYREHLPGQQQLLAGVPITGRPILGTGEAIATVKGAPKRQAYEKFTFAIFYEELRRKDIMLTEGDYLVFHDGEAERILEIKEVSRINSTKGVAGQAPFYLQVSCVLNDAAAYLLPARV